MSKIDEVMESIRRHRDEAKLKLHLAGEDAKQEWAELEQRRDELVARLRQSGDVARDSASDVEAAAELLADELKRGYERIRRTLG